MALLAAKRQEKDGEKEQRRHHGGDNCLRRDLEEAPHLALIERPESPPIDRAETAQTWCKLSCQMGELRFAHGRDIRERARKQANRERVRSGEARNNHERNYLTSPGLDGDNGRCRAIMATRRRGPSRGSGAAAPSLSRRRTSRTPRFTISSALPARAPI